MCTALCAQGGETAADARSGAGNDTNLVFEIIHRSSPGGGGAQRLRSSPPVGGIKQLFARLVNVTMRIVKVTSDNECCQYGAMSSKTTPRPDEAGRAYGGRSMDERRSMRRRQFVDAGIEVFGRDGFRAATVKSLCREAGLTERYFYESFGNSETLFAEVYKTLVSRLEQAVVAAIEAAPREPEATARAGLRVFFETMYNQPGTARILLIEIFGISGDIDKLYRATTRDFTHMLAELSRAMFPLDEPSGTDPAIVSTGLMGSTIHIAMYWTLSHYRDSIDVVVESSLALYVAMAGARRAN